MMKKKLFVKEKTEKKKAIKQRLWAGCEHQIAGGIKEGVVRRAPAFMPNDLVGERGR